jgi:hypothetical protein
MKDGCKVLNYPPKTTMKDIEDGAIKNYCPKFDCECAGSYEDKDICPLWNTALEIDNFVYYYKFVHDICE